MASKTLTISGYEWRLEKYFKTLYEKGMYYSLKVSLFKEIWDLDRIGCGRLYEAFRKLYRKRILIRPIVNGKEMRGSYKWNPNSIRTAAEQKAGKAVNNDSI